MRELIFSISLADCKFIKFICLFFSKFFCHFYACACLGIPLQNMQNISSATQASRHRRALSEGSNDVNREKLQHGINLAEREELCKAYQWGTTTQRSVNAVNALYAY